MTDEPGAPPAAGGGLVVLDTSYTLEMVEQRGVQDSVLCRDLNGFFDHVWTIHPFASMLTSRTWSAEFGRAEWHAMSPRHTFVEGKVGRFAILRRVFPLNFIVSQAALFVSLAGLIRKRRVQAIRSGDPLYTGLFGWALARVTGVPLVVRVNNNSDAIRANTGQPIFPRLFRSAAIEKRVERFVLSRADLVVGPNHDNLRFAIANGANPATSTVFRYGNLIAKQHMVARDERTVDPALLATLGVSAGAFLLYISRLEPVKVPDDAVRVLAAVRERGHDVKLAIVGDGRMEGELRALAVELGVADHLILPGNQPQHVLAQLIAAAAVVVSPHTGRALTEAAYGAAPIVAYDIDWQSELIESGVTGELVPFRDWRAMAQAVDRLLANRDAAATLGRNVLAKAKAMLDPAMLDEHERTTYRALLAG